MDVHRMGNSDGDDKIHLDWSYAMCCFTWHTRVLKNSLCNDGIQQLTQLTCPVGKGHVPIYASTFLFHGQFVVHAAAMQCVMVTQAPEGIPTTGACIESNLGVITLPQKNDIKVVNRARMIVSRRSFENRSCGVPSTGRMRCMCTWVMELIQFSSYEVQGRGTPCCNLLSGFLRASKGDIPRVSHTSG